MQSQALSVHDHLQTRSSKPLPAFLCPCCGAGDCVVVDPIPVDLSSCLLSVQWIPPPPGGPPPPFGLDTVRFATPSCSAPACHRTRTLRGQGRVFNTGESPALTSVAHLPFNLEIRAAVQQQLYDRRVTLSGREMQWSLAALQVQELSATD